MSNMDGIYGGQERPERQEVFWKWIDTMVHQRVSEMIGQVLEFQREAHLAAGWNQRSDKRRGYRNGHY